MKSISLAFGIHNHQPVGNFDYVFEDAYQRAYLPFLEVLERHPHIRCAQHFTGILLEWIEAEHPEFLERLRKLVAEGRVEMMTGGYYEPILAIIPEHDIHGQINKLTEYVEDRLKYEPKGMWLAERIWEPHLPRPLAENGIRYVVIDDAHFKYSGLRDDQLRGYYVTEHEGYTVNVFPISERLRYTIPFQDPDQTLDLLRESATENGQNLIVFADDGEKFGVWPGTYDHCYGEGWLDRFFDLLTQNSDWIRLIHFEEALQQLRPLGNVYLSTASYREMMEWALPAGAIASYEHFEGYLKEQGQFDKYKVFVRGGFWRNFLAKYPEANSLHKKMLRVSRKLRQYDGTGGEGRLHAAHDHLWAGQCNCPYWHGVFGGLYLNNLRFAIYNNLIAAERTLDQAVRSKRDQAAGWVDIEETDYDGDGREELIVETSSQNLYFKPSLGGQLVEWDLKDIGINLVDTMTRREEAYHAKLRQVNARPNRAAEEVASIHDLVVSKEENLDRYLHYDWYRRLSFIDHFIATDTDLDAFASAKYHEMGDFVTEPYRFQVERGPGGSVISFVREGNLHSGKDVLKARVLKAFHVQDDSSGVEVTYGITSSDQGASDLWFGVELNFALLAGDADDRYYDIAQGKLDDPRLRSTGSLEDLPGIALVDEWLGLRIELTFSDNARVWRFPVETVSQSEGGFERVYQSSAVVPMWRVALTPGAPWSTTIKCTFQNLKAKL